MVDDPNLPGPPHRGSSTIVAHTEHPSERHPRVAPRSRVLTVLAVVALFGAAGLAVAGFRAGEGDDSVVLQVDDVSASVPSTVAPLVTEAPVETIPVSEGPESAIPAPTTTEQALSPLTELLGPRYSAVLEEVEPRPRPVGIVSDAIDVADFPIRAVGLEDDGQLEVPDETEIGWYQYGATAGRPGATVLAAHVSWNRTVGPFGALGTMEPGDLINVTLDDGTTREYEVFERTVYGKLELPRERIWRNTGPETLVLITCGGDFNPEIRRFKENIVVYAAPVG